MKKFVFIILFVFCVYMVFSETQEAFIGSFNYGTDAIGNKCVYFQGTNVTDYYLPIVVIARNDITNDELSFSFTVIPHGQFAIGPNQGWVWKKKEKLYIIYQNGRSIYWINDKQVSR